jgi:hypothetical protein
MRSIRSKCWASLGHVTYVTPSPASCDHRNQLEHRQRGEFLPVGLEKGLGIPVEMVVTTEPGEKKPKCSQLGPHQFENKTNKMPMSSAFYINPCFFQA